MLDRILDKSDIKSISAMFIYKSGGRTKGYRENKKADKDRMHESRKDVRRRLGNKKIFKMQFIISIRMEEGNRGSPGQ